MNEEKFRQIVKEETAHLATKAEVYHGLDELDKKLNSKIDGVAFGLGEKINELKESQGVISVKIDALLSMSENFIGKVEKEEQERKIGDTQLERRVEKLEEKVR